MKNIFTILDYKTLMQLNIASVIVTSICEAFAIGLLYTRNLSGNTEGWKYKALIIGVVIISVLFLLSLLLLGLFIRLKSKKTHTKSN